MTPGHFKNQSQFLIHGSYRQFTTIVNSSFVYLWLVTKDKTRNDHPRADPRNSREIKENVRGIKQPMNSSSPLMPTQKSCTWNLNSGFIIKLGKIVFGAVNMGGQIYC